MQKKICYILAFCFLYLVESSPVNLGTLEYDNLDTGLSDLAYEVEEEDYAGILKFLDKIAGKSKPESKNNKDRKKSQTDVRTSGFKKANTANAGIKSKINIGDLNEFFKVAKGHDLGTYDEADIFALAKGIAAAAVGTNENENRTYKKGTKTRGFHRIHHKDEYKKDKEFYEDDETKGTINKVGAKATGTKIGAGIDFNKGHFHDDRETGIHGKHGYLDKGYLDAEINRYSDSQGFNGSYLDDN